jgi:hypothetical protein
VRWVRASSAWLRVCTRSRGHTPSATTASANTLRRCGSFRRTARRAVSYTRRSGDVGAHSWLHHSTGTATTGTNATGEGNTRRSADAGIVHTHTQASQPDCQEKDNGASTLPARTHVRCHTLQTLPTVGAGALQRGRTTARSTSPHRRATTTRSCRETSWTWRSGSVSTAKQRRHLIVTAWRQRNASEPTAPHRRAPRTQAARWKSPASSATGK